MLNLSFGYLYVTVNSIIENGIMLIKVQSRDKKFVSHFNN